MKRKFLITNDVDLSLDKINRLISDIRDEDCTDLDFNHIDETLVEVLAHLQQALDNLAFEEDFDDD